MQSTDSVFSLQAKSRAGGWGEMEGWGGRCCSRGRGNGVAASFNMLPRYVTPRPRERREVCCTFKQVTLFSLIARHRFTLATEEEGEEERAGGGTVLSFFSLSSLPGRGLGNWSARLKPDRSPPRLFPSPLCSSPSSIPSLFHSLVLHWGLAR